MLVTIYTDITFTNFCSKLYLKRYIQFEIINIYELCI